MMLEERAPFQYFKVEVCPNMLSFKNIGGGVFLFCCCFDLVFAFVGLVEGFFNKYLKIVFVLYAGLAYTEL